MTIDNIKELNIPESPGVYLFKDSRKSAKDSGNILYIGKATNIKDRLKSYFSKDLIETRGPAIVKMIEIANGIDFIKTDSVLEAIILEAKLIKKFQPKYNTKEKSDKSFFNVIITKEDFPRIILLRNKDLLSEDKYLKVFGPFTNSSQLKEAIKIIRKIFPFRGDKCIPNQIKPCFERQIGICPGVCTGEISKKEYLKIISNIIMFFDGKKTDLIKKLEKEMSSFAKSQEFERANIIKNRIFALKHINDIALIRKEGVHIVKNNLNNSNRIEAYDIAHMSGNNPVGVFVVLGNGEFIKSDYRMFNIRSGKGNDDVNNLKEIILRRLKHTEWQLPNIIVVDGSIAQKNIVENVLLENNLTIPVVAVNKDNKHRPKMLIGDNNIVSRYRKEILLANNEAHRFAIKSLRKKIRNELYK